MVIELKVDPDKKFQAAVRKASAGVNDLTIPLTIITKQWYKGNNALFALRGPGKYSDISPKYAKKKQREVGQIYPLLEAKKKQIKNAITNPTDIHAVNQILNKKTLVLGVSKSNDFPYAASIYYGLPSKNLPARPYLFLGPEKAAPNVPEIKNRGNIYLKIIGEYCIQVSDGFAK